MDGNREYQNGEHTKLPGIKVAVASNDRPLLPDYCKLSLACYVTSPSTGLNAAITVAGRMDLDFSKTDWPGLLEASCATLNQAGGVKDSRAMTPAEIKEYESDDEKETVFAGSMLTTEADDDEDED